MGAGSVLALPNRRVVKAVYRNKKYVKEAVDFDGLFVLGVYRAGSLGEEVCGEGIVLCRCVGLYEILLAIL